MSELQAIELGPTTKNEDDQVMDETHYFLEKFAKLIYPFYAFSFISCLLVAIIWWAWGSKQVASNPGVAHMFWILFIFLCIGAILGAWATWKFGVIMDQINQFKEENNKYEQELGELRATKDKLAGEVSGLQDKVNELQQDANELDQQLGQFEELRTQLEGIAADNEQLNDMLKDTNQMFADMRKTVLENEQAHLLNFFYECAFRDGDEGMSKREYRRFLGRLSQKQREKFENQGTFEEIAGEDDIIDLSEFQALIEVVIADVDELLKAELNSDDETKADY